MRLREAWVEQEPWGPALLSGGGDGKVQLGCSSARAPGKKQDAKEQAAQVNGVGRRGGQAILNQIPVR